MCSATVSGTWSKSRNARLTARAFFTERDPSKIAGDIAGPCFSARMVLADKSATISGQVSPRVSPIVSSCDLYRVQAKTSGNVGAFQVLRRSAQKRPCPHRSAKRADPSTRSKEGAQVACPINKKLDGGRGAWEGRDMNSATWTETLAKAANLIAARTAATARITKKPADIDKAERAARMAERANEAGDAAALK